MSIIHANKGKGGGKGLFMYCNVNVLSCGGGALLTAPVTPAVIPPAPTPITASFTSGTLTVTYTPGASGTKVRVWCVGTGKNLHRQAGLVAAATGGTYTSAQYKGGKGVLSPWGSLLGQNIYVQAEIIDSASGLGSNPSNTVEVTVA
jgi:hypothetical protein